MDLHHLKSFIAVVEHGSVGKASKALRIPSVAVRLHLKILTNNLGADLLTLRPYALATTEAGDVLLTEGRLLLQKADDLAKRIQQISAAPRPCHIRMILEDPAR